MGKFIKKVTALRCPIHSAVLEECGKQLVDKGYFNKDQVIEKLRFTAIEDSIRWDYLAHFLAEPELGHNFEVVPVAQKFFKSTKADRDRAAEEVDSRGRLGNFGQYLAGGHGKKTAGYAVVNFEGGRLALKRAQNYKSMSNGVGLAFAHFREALAKDQDALHQDVRDKLEHLSSDAA